MSKVHAFVTSVLLSWMDTRKPSHQDNLQNVLDI